MFANRKIAFIFIMCVMMTYLEAKMFISPSHKQLSLTSLSDIERAYSVRKLSLPNTSFIDEIIVNEKEGFLGYHGNSLEFMIYQDIIRYVIQEIVKIPIRNDFHFLAVPLEPLLEIQSKQKLAEIFSSDKNQTFVLSEGTFPLNFNIWDNSTRFGLNSMENYLKNLSVKPLGYRRRLTWFFKRLGIKEKHIDELFNLAYQTLGGHQTGIILQLFDDSQMLYQFAKRIAYPAYPNGFIKANRTVDEYYMDENFMPPYPHEVRLILTYHETLNPNSPIRMIRYVPGLNPTTQKTYETAIRRKIKKYSSSKKSRKSYKKELLQLWSM